MIIEYSEHQKFAQAKVKTDDPFRSKPELFSFLRGLLAENSSSYDIGSLQHLWELIQCSKNNRPSIILSTLKSIDDATSVTQKHPALRDTFEVRLIERLLLLDDFAPKNDQGLPGNEKESWRDRIEVLRWTFLNFESLSAPRMLWKGFERDLPHLGSDFGSISRALHSENVHEFSEGHEELDQKNMSILEPLWKSLQNVEAEAGFAWVCFGLAVRGVNGLPLLVRPKAYSLMCSMNNERLEHTERREYSADAGGEYQVPFPQGPYKDQNNIEPPTNHPCTPKTRQFLTWENVSSSVQALQRKIIKGKVDQTLQGELEGVLKNIIYNGTVHDNFIKEMLKGMPKMQAAAGQKPGKELQELGSQDEDIQTRWRDILCICEEAQKKESLDLDEWEKLINVLRQHAIGAAALFKRQIDNIRTSWEASSARKGMQEELKLERL
ncbi:hypothetical protein BJX66DRAFT_111138 [Aspergillus keveii]|uniref:Uncharacterized protein n=1 Tax=Aspergillus keveii TaxID=714993 RepID=A0ABR4FLB5_9EURO